MTLFVAGASSAAGYQDFETSVYLQFQRASQMVCGNSENEFDRAFVIVHAHVHFSQEFTNWLGLGINLEKNCTGLETFSEIDLASGGSASGAFIVDIDRRKGKGGLQTLKEGGKKIFILGSFSPFW